MRNKLRQPYELSRNKRRSEVHFKRTLKSGKKAHLWLWRDRMYNTATDSLVTVWQVGFTVRDTDKQARQWFRRKSVKPSGITGDGTIEGLAWAHTILEQFAVRIPEEHVITVSAEDERRYRAYRILQRRGWGHNEEEGYYYLWGSA